VTADIFEAGFGVDTSVDVTGRQPNRGVIGEVKGELAYPCLGAIGFGCRFQRSAAGSRFERKTCHPR